MASELTHASEETLADIKNLIASDPAIANSVASGAADSGNPVKVGGKYNATPPTLDDGDRGDIQLDVNGNLKNAPTRVKTNAVIQDWTAVAQNTVVLSAEKALTTNDGAILQIQAAIDTTTAHTGTKFIVQISSAASGNEDWSNLTEFVGLIGTAATDLIENDPLAAGSTSITLTGHALTVLAKRLFIEDGTLANSEMVIESAQSINAITLIEGTTNAHALNVAIFNVAMLQDISIPAGVKRLRVMADNTYDADGSTLNYKVMITSY